MNPADQTISLGLPARGFAHSLSELTKLRVNVMVCMTAACGAYLGALQSAKTFTSLVTVVTVLALGMAACGVAALNQVMERNTDALMKRTCMRPLITGAMSRRSAIFISAISILFALVALWIAVDPTTSLLTLFTCVVYLLAYTPLKLVTPICTGVGAVAGAMPPLIGYRALSGTINASSITLFLILFAWQFPHFHSISLMYREDYAAARIRMLAVVDRSGRRISGSLVVWSTILLIVSILPFVFGNAGAFYLGTALASGSWLLWHAAQLRPEVIAGRNYRLAARHVLRVTLLYLPMVLLTLVINAKR